MTITLSFKASKPLLNLIEEYLKRDAYLSRSDFPRDVAREKIFRDAPELYRKLFQEEDVAT
jgi:metal-responsive CopG/Arc/MetJ family transcriptional regulator